MFSLFRSLFLSTLLSFAMPVILVGGILASLYTASYIPGFTWISETGTTQVSKFLAVFGNGCPLEGMLTIGFAFAFVGSLFDLFNFSMYQGLRNHSSEQAR
ncbi:hypothetical protein [Gloeothece verrucosa]|uniref:hypothetical protein n=1 Tax=Gloeothece verrucosa TaxID=2546359 RepID=UPI000A012ED9|nr:hypothetical protein [Gloeothece verrucosa]